MFIGLSFHVYCCCGWHKDSRMMHSDSWQCVSEGVSERVRETETAPCSDWLKCGFIWLEHERVPTVPRAVVSGRCISCFLKVFFGGFQ